MPQSCVSKLALTFAVVLIWVAGCEAPRRVPVYAVDAGELASLLSTLQLAVLNVPPLLPLLQAVLVQTCHSVHNCLPAQGVVGSAALEVVDLVG